MVVTSMMCRDRITMVAASMICSILFDTVRSFEISGFDRYSIQYSQGCSQAECPKRKVRRLLGLAGHRPALA